MEDKESKLSQTYCVTGATGYIGSWLVKVLLDKGYTVHATLRDPAKAAHFSSTWNGGDRLILFKADLQEEGSYDEAVKGCDGVYHVAASMEFNVAGKDNVENYVQTNIIDPAVKGTLNILKSCSKLKSVKRFVFTSSISTMTAKDNNGQWLPVVDESCQTPIETVWKRKSSGWVYVLSKLKSEEAAIQFAKENGIDLVSVITTTVAGPFLTPTVPSSIRVVISPLTGEHEYCSLLSAVSARMGSIALVHIEDICNAHIFLMEHPKAEGRYLCCVQSCLMSELLSHLSQEYPTSKIQRIVKDEQGFVPSEISSKKLRDLGFSFKHELQEIIHQALTSCVKHGLLHLTAE